MNRTIAHVDADVVAIVGGAIDTSVAGFVSSATGGRIASAVLGGGELLFGRLAADNVGELVDWDWANGTELDDPVDCVCANLVRLFRLV